MLRKSALVLMACFFLAACVTSGSPRIIQPSSKDENIFVTVGMATQIEVPTRERVTSAVVGDENLVLAEPAGDVVNLSGKESGETNLIIRARDNGGDSKVYKYRIIIQKP